MGSRTSLFLINRKTYILIKSKAWEMEVSTFQGPLPKITVQVGKGAALITETYGRKVSALKAAWSDLGPTGPAKLTEKFRFTLNLILIPRKPNTLLSLLFTPFILNLFISRGTVLMVHTLRKCFCKKINWMSILIEEKLSLEKISRESFTSKQGPTKLIFVIWRSLRVLVPSHFI